MKRLLATTAFTAALALLLAISAGAANTDSAKTWIEKKLGRPERGGFFLWLRKRSTDSPRSSAENDTSMK
jgi:hypothetical protein